MKAARFSYVRPRSLGEALDAIARQDGSSRLIAGSQSLGPMLNLRLVRPERLIDISALHELRGVSRHEDMLRVGAAVTHSDIEDGVHEALHDHPWRRVAGTIAYRSVRNRGTLGGSLAHADPAADWVLAAWACDAQVELGRSTGARLVPIHQFMQAAYTTVIEPDEIVLALRIPQSVAQSAWGYYKVCRKIGDFAEASCAVVIDDRRGVCRIAIGALDGPPVLLDSLAQMLLRERAQPQRVFDAIDSEVKAAIPESDPVTCRMVSATVRRSIDRALGRDGEQS
ncbi:MAG: hypothetical protein RL322_1636 [Pseudomonadota bacterium]